MGVAVLEHRLNGMCLHPCWTRTLPLTDNQGRCCSGTSVLRPSSPKSAQRWGRPPANTILRPGTRDPWSVVPSVPFLPPPRSGTSTSSLAWIPVKVLLLWPPTDPPARGYCVARSVPVCLDSRRTSSLSFTHSHRTEQGTGCAACFVGPGLVQWIQTGRALTRDLPHGCGNYITYRGTDEEMSPSPHCAISARLETSQLNNAEADVKSRRNCPAQSDFWNDGRQRVQPVVWFWSCVVRVGLSFLQWMLVCHALRLNRNTWGLRSLRRPKRFEGRRFWKCLRPVVGFWSRAVGEAGLSISECWCVTLRNRVPTRKSLS